MESEIKGTKTEHTLEPGEHVFTGEGTLLGAVAEVRGGYFAVRLRYGDDGWFSRRYAEMTDDYGVHLSLRCDEVAARQLTAPGLEDAESRRSDLVIDDGEALEQRERMECELAVQRARMPRERTSTHQ